MPGSYCDITYILAPEAEFIVEVIDLKIICIKLNEKSSVSLF